MSKSQRAKAPKSLVPSARGASATATDTPTAPHVDIAELATGLLIAAVILIGARALPALFAQARDIVITAAVFEMSMPMLALGADHAETVTTPRRRIAWLGVGAALTFASAALTAITLQAPGLIVGGAWLLYSRMQCPRSVPRFSAQHCRVVSVVAGMAWACLLIALALLMLGTWMSGVDASGEASPWVYAIAWGGFYVILAFVLPAARRHALKPVIVKSLMRGRSLSRR